MLTAQFTLTFPDGQTVVASIECETPDRNESVSYSGAVDRLPRKYDRADVAVLRVWAEHVAEEIGARVTEKVEGRYDRWAE